MTASINVDPLSGELLVRFPYDAGVVAELKRMLPGPERRWNPEIRAWRVAPWHRRAVERLLRRHGLIDPEPFQPPPPPRPPADLAGAVAAVLAALPTSLRKPTWKALARTWHPDTGGDAEATRALLTVRERAA